MKTLSASEAKQRLAAVIDAAARETVVIRRQKRDVAVVLPMQECERLGRPTSRNSNSSVTSRRWCESGRSDRRESHRTASG
jgi:prevent-host-death family protein